MAPVHLEYEEILEHIGSLGKYQIILFNLIASFSWKNAANMVVTVFHVIRPSFVCADGLANQPSSAIIRNRSLTSDQCYGLNGTLSGCQSGFLYDNAEWRETIVTQWDLVCDKEGLEPLVFASYALGYGLGLILGALADKFGRKPVVLISCLLETICTIVEAMSPSFEFYLIVHLIHGLFATVCLLSTVCITEFVGCKHRSMVANLLWLYWCLGYMSVAGVAYIVRHWRWLQFITCLPCATYIASYFVLYESPRWLIANGRYSEALRVCETIARVNGKSIPTATTELLMSQTPVYNPEGHVKEMFNTRVMLRKTIILFFAWFVISLTYYGVSLDSSFVTDNVFINTLLSGLVEVPAYIVAWIVAEKVGRRLPMVGMYAMMSVSLIVINVLADDSVARALLALLAKLSVTSAFSVIIHYTAELYPTSIRNTGVFSCNAISRLSAVAAPFVVMNSSVTRLASTVTFGCLGLLSAVGLWFLPETKGIPLPQSVQEANIITPGKELTFMNLVQRRREEIAVYFVGRGESASVTFRQASPESATAASAVAVNGAVVVSDDDAAAFGSTKYLVNPFV